MPSRNSARLLLVAVMTIAAIASALTDSTPKTPQKQGIMTAGASAGILEN